MTKKQLKAKNNQNRVRTLFNTGTRTHKSKKDYDRKKEKLFCKKYLNADAIKWQGRLFILQ